jgi:hypothetical protein
MRPVEVRLSWGRPFLAKDALTLVLPRAWITFEEEHSPLDFDQVPDRIATRMLRLSLADPDVTALSIEVSRSEQSAKISRSEALRRLRANEYEVTLQRLEPPMSQDGAPQRMANPAVVAQDGLSYDAERGAYFLRVDEARLTEVRCMGKPHPVWFCNYQVWINPAVAATITFLDFRAHGGPDYAITRIRRVLASLCRQSTALC